MKTDQEIVNSRTALRVASGLLVVVGSVALMWNTIHALGSGNGVNVLEGVTSIGALYGLYLFGYFALKGKLPPAKRNSGKA